MAQTRLPLENLSDRHPGLTRPLADSYCEAARVCLDRHHISPVDVHIDNAGTEIEARAEWLPTSVQMRGAWANETDTTEAGAYGVVLAAIEISHSLVAVRRAETRTGADYYVGPPGSSSDDLEDAIRLEISGIDKGSVAAVFERLRAKVVQASRGSSNLPALAGVVAFRAKIIALQPVDRK